MIGIPVVLPQDLVFLLLPQQLVLSPMRLKVLDQVTSSEGEHPEKLFELLGWDVEVLLESFEEVVVGRLVLGLTLVLLALDGSVTQKVSLDP